MAKIGVWLIGALGNVATCTIAGVEAIKGGLISKNGFVTELELFKELELIDFNDIIFGGYDIREGNLHQSLLEFQRENGIITDRLIEAIRNPLLEISKNIKSGITFGCGKAIKGIADKRLDKDSLTVSEAIGAIQSDISDFKNKYHLDAIVVVNLASNEPSFELPDEFNALEELTSLIEKNRRDILPASVLYAYASLDAGFHYINFTASLGSNIPALDHTARLRGVLHMGKDGKTGETLVKTALAPLFTARNLKILSWESHNILGNRDGLVLNNPDNSKSKLKDKDDVLKNILPENGLHSNVRIDYVPSLGDWKTAWDFIHFTGFMDTKMSLQFTWQGADSILAAPLIMDLVRLTEFAHRTKEKGAMTHLSSFFKSPYGVQEHDFYKQFAMLVSYVGKHSKEVNKDVKSEFIA